MFGKLHFNAPFGAFVFSKNILQYWIERIETDGSIKKTKIGENIEEIGKVIWKKGWEWEY